MAFYLQVIHSFLTDLDNKIFAVFKQVSVEEFIALDTLAMDIEFVKPDGFIVSCSVEVPCVHLIQRFGMITGDADKEIVDGVALADVGIEYLLQLTL